jgi:hypothetical protein
MAWNPNFHDRVRTCLLHVLTLSQINPIHDLPCYCFILHFIITLSHMSQSYMWSHSFRFHCQNPVPHTISPIRAWCPTRLDLLDLVTVIIFGEEYRSSSFSICNFLHSLVTSSPLAPSPAHCSSKSLAYVLPLTFRWLMSYIYGVHILDVSRSHTTTQHSR